MKTDPDYCVEARLGDKWMVQYRTDRLSLAMRQMNVSYGLFGYESDVRVLDWDGNMMGRILGRTSQDVET